MTLAAWLTLGVLAVVFALLMFTRFGPDTILFGGLSLLIMADVVTPSEAFSGFTNEGIITVGIFFVVAAGLRETGAMWFIISGIMGRARSIMSAQARIMFPVAFMSAFWNNTPLVAVLLPAIQDWSRKYEIAPSKLLIPLSYAAILGGMCTLIGTSTNLVVDGLLKETPANLVYRTAETPDLVAEANTIPVEAISLGVYNPKPDQNGVKYYPGLGFFEVAWVGIPAALLGITYILLFGGRLLPERYSLRRTLEAPREYMIDMLVVENGPLIDKSLQESGLLDQQGMYLMEMERGGHIIDDPQDDEVLQANDRLVFVGVINATVELHKTKGLVPATPSFAGDNSPVPDRGLVEAVVSSSSPMRNKTISEGRFHTRYGAVVIGVARNGERIDDRLGDISLQPGDTLLLEAQPTFVDQYRDSSDFFLVSRIEGYTPPRHDRAWVALGILGMMVIALTFQWMSVLKGGLLAAALMLATRCLTPDVARRALDWRLLITIASAFGIGRALDQSGAAGVLAYDLLIIAQGNPWLTLALIHLTTMIFTELISNVAAAVLVFPIALTLSQQLGCNFMPFAITIMVAGSASFATPVGYQTNLMVYGPGGYKFSDFLRIGLPLNIMVATLAIVLIPNIWPF
jgi:di/tricarboxylate transporter